MRLSLEWVRTQAPNRPEGYYEDVVSRGEIIGEDHLEITDAALDGLYWKYRGSTLKSALTAVSAWVEAGCPMLTPEQKVERRVICEACDKWNPSAWAGLGGCRLCGCSSAKLSMATEACPIGKWQAIQPARAVDSTTNVNGSPADQS